MKRAHLNFKVRPRIQRTFLDWLASNRERFAVPIRITKRTDRHIEWWFVGVNPIVYGVLTWEIGVGVEWEGETWDYLTFFEASPRRTAGGYLCSMCIPEARQVFASREVLWRDHLFEPFLEWVNDDLAKARWIGIYGGREEDGTWAKLHRRRCRTRSRERRYGMSRAFVSRCTTRVHRRGRP